MRIHHLKTYPEHFKAVAEGRKTAELRLDDRGFEEGDAIQLREWNPVMESYPGPELIRTITHIYVFSECPRIVMLSLSREDQ